MISGNLRFSAFVSLPNQGLLNFFISVCIESYKKSVEKKLDAKMELNEKICMETERLVSDIKMKEEDLKIKEKALEKSTKIFKTSLTRECESLMDKMKMNVERKIKPLEKRLDTYDHAKSKNDNARITALANSLDFYKKKV